MDTQDTQIIGYIQQEYNSNNILFTPGIGCITRTEHSPTLTLMALYKYLLILLTAISY